MGSLLFPGLPPYLVLVGRSLIVDYDIRRLLTLSVGTWVYRLPSHPGGTSAGNGLSGPATSLDNIPPRPPPPPARGSELVCLEEGYN